MNISNSNIAIGSNISQSIVGDSSRTREYHCGKKITISPAIFLTGDTQHCPHQISKFYDKADFIFHDTETAPYYSKVHAHYDDLKTLDPQTKAKMWLCHYQPNPTQDPIKDGFLGFVKKGQVLEF